MQAGMSEQIRGENLQTAQHWSSLAPPGDRIHTPITHISMTRGDNHTAAAFYEMICETRLQSYS